MLLVFLCIVFVLVVSLLLHLNDDGSFLGGFIAPIFLCASMIGLFVLAVMTYGYTAAEYKTNIINREYGKNYTQKEVFYASDVIDTVRELNRKRVEINGDIITGK